MVGIYKITNLLNGKCYIGQSVNIDKRWNTHRTAPFNPNRIDYDTPLYRAMRKYGVNHFQFEVLEECPKAELNEKEIYYIRLYNSMLPSGYNQDGGGSTAGHPLKLTADDVKLIRHRLKTTNDTFVQIGKDFGVAHNMIGWINVGKAWHLDGEEYPLRPKQDRLNMYDICPSCGNKKLRNSSLCDRCSRMNNGLRKRIVERPSPVELAKMIIESGFSAVGRQFGVNGNAIKRWCKDYNIPHRLKELDKWYRNQIGISSEEIKKGKGPYRRKINQVDAETGEILQTFNSVVDAANYLGNEKLRNHIGSVCKGTRKSCGGYKWSYVNENN